MVKTHFSLLGIISYIGYTLTSVTHYTLKYILLDSSQIYTIFSLVDKTSQVTNPEIMIKLYRRLKPDKIESLCDKLSTSLYQIHTNLTFSKLSI